MPMDNNLVLLDEFSKVPSDKDLCAALMVAIGTHPLVNQAVVYDPGSPVDQRKPVKITKFRLYGGKELPSDGLTLSLYPSPQNLGVSNGNRYFQSFTPQTTGPGYADGSSDSVLAKFHLQLSLRNAAFDISYPIEFSKIPESPDVWCPADKNIYGVTERTYNQKYDAWPTPDVFNVQVLPAEEVLKEWITILRYVIRDIRRLRPFEVRSPQVTEVFYESGEIFDSKPENLVFHRATIQFELRYSEGNFGR